MEEAGRTPPWSFGGHSALQTPRPPEQRGDKCLLFKSMSAVCVDVFLWPQDTDTKHHYHLPCTLTDHAPSFRRPENRSRRQEGLGAAFSRPDVGPWNLPTWPCLATAHPPHQCLLSQRVATFLLSGIHGLVGGSQCGSLGPARLPTSSHTRPGVRVHTPLRWTHTREGGR